MGTSSMYSGYSNGSSQKNPLLPSDFDDDVGAGNDNDNSEGNEQNENQNADNQQQPPPSISNWQSAKNLMSKLASGTSKSTNARGRAVSKYIKAYGGSKSATKNAVSGINTTYGLGSFINSASTQGIKETLDIYKIEYQNKSTSEVLFDLINFLAPNPITKEDSIARKALILTMEKLYELIENEGLEIESIEKLDINTINVIIPLNIENYIYERLLNDLGSRIENNSINSTSAVKLEKELKDYINSKVEIAFKGKDLSGANLSKPEIESLYNQCYTVMENMI
ncbi:Qat anti-phage system associated protein QatB [Amniculibacterium aquaticum]|uniref:Qat anti-phage system associated protein QatB n=1 Tax=Amniculibacterium aquaticum TaxID=2479858 RepID=UPI000F593DA8|nr:Qat anti-phage system associated protein QatB [Amniculibacterium aquaticum]